jgi:hypothetical protein
MLETWPHDVDLEEVQRRFVVPPELRAPVPRRVVPRDKSGTSCRAKTGNSCLGCLLLPMFLIGFMLAFWAGLSALLLPFGAPATGTVVEREPFSGRRDAAYNLKFRFRTPRGEYSGDWLVRPDFWKRVRVGDPVKVRYFPFAPGLHPLVEEGLSPWTAILGWAPLGFLFMGVSGLPLAGFLTPRRGKRLVQRGLVAPVFISSRDLERGEIEFLLCLPDGRVLEIKTLLARAVLDSLRPGRIRTALYFPSHPNRARLYDVLDWRAQPDGRVTLRP